MKAIVIEKAGGIENFIYKDIVQPVPNENEVLVDVMAIGVNPVDYKVRLIEEVLNMICGEGYPAILGWDIAGEVVSVGDKVSEYNIGDRVFGMINFPGRGNAYAAKVVAPASHLSLIPKGISFDNAAATTLAALTALQVLKNNVKSGDKVLIHAGSGGVGHFAIQIAKHLGAYVITTCSAKNRDFVMSLGADEHIDYREQNFVEVLNDIDFVLDSLGDENVAKSLNVMKPGGSIISLPSPQFSDTTIAEAKKRNVDVSFLMVTSNGDDMDTLKSYLEQDIIKPHVSKTFSFEEMGAAHTQLESGRTVGKVVVTI